MKKLRQLNKRIMGVLLLLSMLITVAPVMVSSPEEAKADSAGTTYIEGIGHVTILYESASGYKYCLDANQNLIVEGKYYSSPSATTSYHTQRLYFTRYPSGLDPTNCLPYYSVTPVSHTTTPPDPYGYVHDTYKISNQQLVNVMRYLFGGEIDLLKESPQQIYMSEGFSLKTRKSASDKYWKVQSSPIYKSYDEMMNAGNGNWQWSSDTQRDLMSHYDVPLTLDYNDLTGGGTGKKYKLTTSEEGNGLVSGSTGEFAAGTSVYELAVPDNGHRFVEWKGDKSGITGVDWTSEYIRFDMPRRNVHLTAVFEPVDGPTPVPTKEPVADGEMEEKDPDVTLPPTPTPEPTPSPKPSYPTEDRIIYENTHRAFTTDKGYTWQAIREKGGYLPNHTDSKYWQMYRFAKTDTNYSVGTDADGNSWYFMADGALATYVHPHIYKGYNANTEEVRFIEELVFPSKITCNGTTYTVTSIGGGTDRYQTNLTVQDKSSWNDNGIGSSTLESYGPLSGGYNYNRVIASSDNYMATEGCGNEYWVGVIGNGGISGYGSQWKNWPTTGAEHSNDYAQTYNVYNTTLKYVTIPNTVNTVMYRAFYGCQALIKISGGEGLQNIGVQAFPAMGNEVEISEQESSNQYNIYQYNESYSFDYVTQTMKEYGKTMTLPEYLQLAEFPRLKSIGESAFYNRSNLHDVVLPSGLIEICKDAFADCLLTSIKIPGASTTIHNTMETLGTAGRGEKRTTIITVPESKAMYYGMEHLYYYKLRCGYKITYRNNFEPAETYETTAEFREIWEDVRYIYHFAGGGYSGASSSGLLYWEGGQFFMISDSGEAYLGRYPDDYDDGPPSAEKVEALAGVKIEEVIKEYSYQYVVGSSPSGAIYDYQPAFLMRTATGEFVYYKVPYLGEEEFKVLDIPADAYQIQFTQLYSLTPNSSIGDSDEKRQIFEDEIGTYIYYLRSDGRIYRTKYVKGSRGFSVQESECVSIASTKRFESFVIQEKNYIGGATTAMGESKMQITAPKIFAKTDEGECLCGYYSTGLVSLNQTVFNKGPHASLYNWVEAEPYRDILPFYGGNGGTPQNMGFLITEDGNLLIIDYEEFISKSVSDDTTYMDIPLDTGIKLQRFEVPETEGDAPIRYFARDEEGFIYILGPSTFYVRIDSIKITGSKFYRTDRTLKISSAIKDAIRLCINENVSLGKLVFGKDSYSYGTGGFGWEALVTIDNKNQIWRLPSIGVGVATKCGQVPVNVKHYNISTATNLVIQDVNLDCYLATFPPSAAGGVPRKLEIDSNEYLKVKTHYPTTLVCWHYLETIYDNMFPRDGYTFLHWNTEADDSGKKYYPGVDVSVDKAMSLYGQWEKTVNKVKYHPNGGSGLMEDSTCDPLVTNKVTLSECLYTKEGHGFTGWNTKKDGTGTMYQPGQVFTTTQKITYLYAQWKPMDYVLKVATDDVRVRPVTATSHNMKYDEEFTIPAALPNKALTVDYRLNQKYTMSTTPRFKTALPLSDAYTKAQLTFEGWMLYEEILANSHYEYLNRFYTPGQKDKNFARRKEYAPILFPSWGGVASYVKLPVAECDGYWFIGWTDTANETDEEKVIHAEDGSGAMYQPKKNETLYAYYQPREYEIDLVVDVEDAEPGEITLTQTEVLMTFDEQIPNVAVPQSDIYIFMGYYDKLDADGIPTADAVQYYDENGAATIDTRTGTPMVWRIHDESVTKLYAYFISEIEVTLDGRGATKQEQKSVTMTYDQVGPDVIPPEKTGYTFHGYYTGTRGTGKQYFDANGKGSAVWLEKRTDILYAYWIQDSVELPEKDPTENPDVLPEDRVVIEASLDKSTVHIYADDNDPATGAVTDVQPYLVSDVVIDGKVVAEGAIPSTENVAIRAKMGAWMLSSVLERRSGVDYVRVYVTVPYQTQYEDEETEELIISDIQYATYDFMIPKAWSYWVVADGGIYFPEKVVVENEALGEGKESLNVEWNVEGAAGKPTYRIAYYGEKSEHVIWNLNSESNRGVDTDGVPCVSVRLSSVETIVSMIPGELPDVSLHLQNVCQNAAWRENSQFAVRSDGLMVEGVKLLEDAIFETGIGAMPNLYELENLIDRIEETTYQQTYKSGVWLRKEAKNDFYETKATIEYVASEANVGEHKKKSVSVTEANEIKIHTPVLCDPIITADNDTMYQCERIPAGSTVLVLDEEGRYSDFCLRVENIGYHSDKKGYGERDYGAYSAKRNGEVQNEVCFPFPVWLDTKNDGEKENDIRIPKGEWYLLGDREQRFYVPIDTKEGIYELSFRSVAVNGAGREENTEEYCNSETTAYVATGSVSVFLTGRLYDFTVYRVQGTTAWDEVEESDMTYTVGIQTESDNVQKTLPLRRGGHPKYRNLGGLPMGGEISFRMKSIGSSFGKGSTVTIVPYLSIRTEDEVEVVDVYYEEETERGVFLRKWEEEEQKRRITVTEDTEGAIREWQDSFRLPNELYVAQKGTDVFGIQRKEGLSFKESFWIKKEPLVLCFAITLENPQGEKLYYGRIPRKIKNNIWKTEAKDSYREDSSGNCFEILGGEVAIIYPGDSADEESAIYGIY